MGIMDIMGLMGGSDTDGGMMSQIKSAGESFAKIAQDIDTIKAQNAEIIDKLDEILSRENSDG
jgi:hypothetical protein